MDEAEVAVGELVPSDEESAKAVEPGMADFDHPAPWRMTLGIAWRGERLLGRGFGRDVRRVAMLLCLFSARRVVVAAIQAQVLLGLHGLLLWLHGLFHQGGIQQLAQLLHVMAIGSRKHNRHRNACPIGQEVALGAALCAVGGVASRGLRLSLDPLFWPGALMRHPSAACHSNCSPTSPSYSCSKSAQAASSLL